MTNADLWQRYQKYLCRVPALGLTLDVSRMTFDAVDLLWRNLRLAGRADIVRLSRQLHRNEDKLERVLQEVETLRDDLTRERARDRDRDRERDKEGAAS